MPRIQTEVDVGLFIKVGNRQVGLRHRGWIDCRVFKGTDVFLARLGNNVEAMENGEAKAILEPLDRRTKDSIA